MKTVADIMTPAPIVVEVPGSRSDAINVMVKNNLTGVPVIRASDGKLMGIVSRRDIFRKFDEEQLSLIMKKDCIIIGPDASIADAAKILSEKRIHRLPVVDKGKLIGIITPTDILREIRGMKTDMTAGDVISTTCVTVWEGDPMSYLVSAFRISDTVAAPVLDAQGNLVGIITDRDLFSDQFTEEDAKKLGVEDAKLVGLRNVMPLFYTATDKYKSNDKTVEDYMVRKPITVFRKTSLSEVARLMVVNDFGQVPVHGTKDELVGMIYDVDVLRAITGADE
jgi:CBS domain-containing protein